MEQFLTEVPIWFEVVGVAVILVGFFVSVASVVLFWIKPVPGLSAYEVLRGRFGRSIVLGLEFLVAADLIRTVTVELTLTNLTSLALLVLIRTFLSFSLEVEIEGRWPWQRWRTARSESGGES